MFKTACVHEIFLNLRPQQRPQKGLKKGHGATFACACGLKVCQTSHPYWCNQRIQIWSTTSVHNRYGRRMGKNPDLRGAPQQSPRFGQPNQVLSITPARDVKNHGMQCALRAWGGFSLATTRVARLCLLPSLRYLLYLLVSIEYSFPALRSKLVQI